MLKNRLELEVTADTLEGAVEKALLHFECSRADISVEVLRSPRAGFLGVFRQPAKVRVRLTDRAYIAALTCQELLTHVGFSATCQPSAGSECIDIDITGEDSSGIIGTRGQTLDALNHLVQAMTDRVSDDRIPVKLDCESYRQRRLTSLNRLARRLSSKVKQTGKSVTIPPLPPQERRILHLKIEADPSVHIKSVGRGYERKMVISPR